MRLPDAMSPGSSLSSQELTGVMGFAPPPWDARTTSLRPVHHDPEDFEPGATRDADLFARLDDSPVLTVVQVQAWHCPHALRAASVGRNFICSACTSFIASVCLFP